MKERGYYISKSVIQTLPSAQSSVEATKKALDDGITKYTNSMGMIVFREAIADYIRELEFQTRY